MHDPKKEGTLIFRVRYRLLNLLTKKNLYPRPQIYWCIGSLGEATILLNLDCNASCLQVAIAPEDREMAALVSHGGAYQYKHMPFGLTNAPATLQQGFHMTIAGFKWQSCLIYLDDVLL